MMQSTSIGGTDSAEQYLPARQVWERYGVTSMTLWRWLKDADLKFPQPIHIGRHRYWRLSDLLAWERARCPKSVAEIEGNGDTSARARSCATSTA